MLLVTALLTTVFIQSAWAQSCGVTPTGPCLGSTCPAGNTCLTNLASPICCPTLSVVPATTTTIPTTAVVPVTGTCVDLLNPSTGVSDCPGLAYLCTNSVYYTLMTQQCPRTCNRCPAVVVPPTTTSNTCADLLNPQTGVSDCPARAYLCNDATYYAVMTQQCPNTCNRCPGTAVVAPVVSASCVDLLNPQTGVSDCPSRASLCNNAAYYTLMTQQCPMTCNRCTGTATTAVAVVAATCVDLLNPTTGVSDCPSRAYLCNDAVYYTLMTQQCPLTCNRCTGAATTTVAVPTTTTLPPTTTTTPPPTTTTLPPTTTTVAAVTTTAVTGTCFDLLNPSTGVSDCPSRAYLCNNSVYFTLMTQQCPRTCNRCTAVATTAVAVTCVDLLNPSTGVSDCPSRAYLCNNSSYYTLMTQQCPRTCGRCATGK